MVDFGDQTQHLLGLTPFTCHLVPSCTPIKEVIIITMLVVVVTVAIIVVVVIVVVVALMSITIL